MNMDEIILHIALAKAEARNISLTSAESQEYLGFYSHGAIFRYIWSMKAFLHPFNSQ